MNDHAIPRPPIERLVTPSLAGLTPERLAKVISHYRYELHALDAQAYHCCGWALEAIDTLLSDTLRLREELGHPASLPEPKRHPEGPRRIRE